MQCPLESKNLSGDVGFTGVCHFPVHAQYTANFQTNIISGVVSIWVGSYGDYSVGSAYFADVLIIQNGGILSNRYGTGGYFQSNSNTVLITGSGSAWVNEFDFSVGYSGRVNQVAIESGGRISCRDGRVGYGLGLQ